MKQIHLTDSRMRNTRVHLSRPPRKKRIVMVDSQARPVTPVRLVKGSVGTDYTTLSAHMDPLELAKAMIEGEPEVDVELFGKRMRETRRIYLTEKSRPAGGIRHREAVFDAAGHLLEEREERLLASNIDTAVALKWGRLFPKRAIATKLVFTGSYQLVHGDGLTYDFLYQMAQELQEKDALMLLGAGEQGNQPLVFQRNGTQFRAFLEGRVQEDRYLLVVHLSNLALKTVPA